MDRKRAGFDVEWGLEMKAEIRKTFDNLDETRFQKFIPEVVVVDDKTVRQALKSCVDANVDVLVTNYIFFLHLLLKGQKMV